MPRNFLSSPKDSLAALPHTFPAHDGSSSGAKEAYPASSFFESMRIELGPLTFDDERRQLLDGAREVHLRPKAFQLLGLLIEARPRALSKLHILERLWPEAPVTETTLACLVSEVRSALREDARSPRFVHTAHGIGYAFADLPVQTAGDTRPPFSHSLLWGDRELPLAEGVNSLGRERGLPVWVAHPSVSRTHARLIVRGETVTLEDLASKNGTFRFQERVVEPVELADRDEVRVGSVRLLYRRIRVGGPTETRCDG